MACAIICIPSSSMNMGLMFMGQMLTQTVARLKPTSVREAGYIVLTACNVTGTHDFLCKKFFGLSVPPPQFLLAAGNKMALQHIVVRLLKQPQCSIHLLGYIHAVFALLDHFEDTLDLPADLPEVGDSLAFVGVDH